MVSTSAVTQAARIGPGTKKPAASATIASPAVNPTPADGRVVGRDLDDERHDADDDERARRCAQHMCETGAGPALRTPAEPGDLSRNDVAGHGRSGGRGCGSSTLRAAQAAWRARRTP